jgi:hypothetical protein
MSFFDTEEAHAGMLAYAADEGGLPWCDDTGMIILDPNLIGMCGTKQNPLVPGLGQGRAALKVTPTSLHLYVCCEDGRPPGSSGKSALKAPS